MVLEFIGGAVGIACNGRCGEGVLAGTDAEEDLVGLAWGSMEVDAESEEDLLAGAQSVEADTAGD